MKLRTQKQEKTITVTHNGETATFTISYLTPKNRQDLVKQATVPSWDRNQRFEEVDFYLFKILKIDKAIIGWGDEICDEEGNKLPCTKENKEIVYAYNTELIDKVLEEVDQYGLLSARLQEDSEKNLRTGSSGKIETKE